MGNLSTGLSVALAIWIWVVLILQLCAALVAIDELLGTSDRGRRKWCLLNLALQIVIVGTGFWIWMRLP